MGMAPVALETNWSQKAATRPLLRHHEPGSLLEVAIKHAHVEVHQLPDSISIGVLNKGYQIYWWRASNKYHYGDLT